MRDGDGSLNVRCWIKGREVPYRLGLSNCKEVVEVLQFLADDKIYVSKVEVGNLILPQSIIELIETDAISDTEAASCIAVLLHGCASDDAKSLI